jgi:drug/metabolite transporter (DMT)-like permease
MQWKSAQRAAFVALLAGATGIGFAPIFVRLSELGPSATAFYRLFFALPVLALVSLVEPKPRATLATHATGHSSSPGGQSSASTPGLGKSPSIRWILQLCSLAGFLFAGDLAFWHWSIKLTSVANSTLLTNCAPLFVLLGARLVFKERITPALVTGMAVAALGAAMLVGVSWQLTSRHLIGDLLALITAVFYGGYILTIKYLRLTLPPARILAWSGVVSCLFLLLISLVSHEPIQILTVRGWLVLLALSLISHVGGQGLIAYALAHLPAGFSSVSLLLQPVVAAALAWFLLSEPLSLLQGVGGAVILAGIALSSRSRD